jgi:hypothetical protein
VDATGRRHLLLRRAAIAFGGAVLVYLVLLGISVAGGSTGSRSLIPFARGDQAAKPQPPPHKGTAHSRPRPHASTRPATAPAAGRPAARASTAAQRPAERRPAAKARPAKARPAAARRAVRRTTAKAKVRRVAPPKRAVKPAPRKLKLVIRVLGPAGRVTTLRLTLRLLR